MKYYRLILLIWKMRNPFSPKKWGLQRWNKGKPNARHMVESSDKSWSTGEGIAKPLPHTCLENQLNSLESKKHMIPEDEPPNNGCPTYSWEKALEEMKRLSQSGNNTQLWMCLVQKVKSDDIKKKLHRIFHVHSCS